MNKEKYISILFLMIGFNVTMANPLSQVNTNQVSENLSQYMKNSTDGWFAYQIKAAPETRSMCCFNKDREAVCDLNTKQYGYGSSSDNGLTENITILTQIKQGQVSHIMPIGDHCQIVAEGVTVDWLHGVTENQSINWLKNQAVSSGDENGSLYVLSLHENQAAAETMYDLAKKENNKQADQAIFWLGQRKHDGFKYLDKLFQELPKGQLREKINFALSQHGSSEAFELLKAIATDETDPQQQEDAIFWLSQSDDIENMPAFLMDILNQSKTHAIKDKVIFSISQIKSADASETLSSLVNQHKDSKVREKALFWLAQNDPEQAQKAATQLLEKAESLSEQENAVFVLSQLPEHKSSEALFGIIKGDYAKNIKKKAIFWLSQSDDEKTLNQLQDLL